MLSGQKTLRSLALFVALGTVMGVTHAQAYPARPIRLVVGFGPGGASDIIGRLIAEKMSAGLKQSIVVENRPGANGTLAAGFVAKAKPDGYTLALTGPGSISMGPIMYKNTLTYSPTQDLTPVGMIGAFPLVLVVNSDVPVKTLPEFVQYAKDHAQELQFASFGNGSPSHLASEMFKRAIDADITHIPFKGSTDAMTNLMGGHVDVLFDTIPSVATHIKSDRIVALGVTAANPVSQLPELPTLAQNGFPGFEAGGWVAIHAPTGTPDAIVQQLNTELNRILAMPDVVERLSALGAQVISGPPQTLADYASHESQKMNELIEATGLVF